MSKAVKQTRYVWTPLVVLVSGIIWYCGKDTLTHEFWWDVLCVPFGLFVVYLILRVGASVMSRGRTERHR